MTSSYPLPSIGFETGVTVPMVSEYFKYVSIDATTTRASTVMRSMPTSETRTHASMTIPLSRTRSSTSTRPVDRGGPWDSVGIRRVFYGTKTAHTFVAGTVCWTYENRPISAMVMPLPGCRIRGGFTALASQPDRPRTADVL